MHALPQTMEAFLVRMREHHGSMEGYAAAIGLDDAVLQARAR